MKRPSWRSTWTHRALSLCWLGVGPLVCTSVFGQASIAQLPGAISSDLLRQQERELERLRSEPLPQDKKLLDAVPAREPSELRDSSVKFELKAVNFNESAILLRPELDAIVAPYLGRATSFTDLQSVIKDINALYDRKGFVTARAMLPAQRVSEGQVRIELVEGRVGAVRLEGNTYIQPNYVTERLSMQAGDLVDPTRLEADLARFNRISQARLSAALQPGASFGLTDVQLTLTEPPRHSVDVFFSNHGYESTGTATAGLIYQHHGLAGKDDAFTLFLNGSQGTSAGSLSYDYPFNRHGGRIGFRAGVSSAKVIDGPFASIDSRSDSRNGYLTLSHPLWMNQAWLLTGQLNHGRQKTRNTVSGVFLNEDQVTSTQAELSARYTAAGRSLYLNWYIQDAKSEMLGTPTRKAFTLTGGAWQFSQAWSPRFHATFSGGWQYARQEGLPSSLLFQIGGPSTVRGYRSGEIAGDGGVYVNLQGHYQLTSDVSAYGFYDRGLIDSSFRQPEQLESVGAGLNWRINAHVSAEAFVGVPLIKVTPDQSATQLGARMVFHW